MKRKKIKYLKRAHRCLWFDFKNAVAQLSESEEKLSAKQKEADDLRGRLGIANLRIKAQRQDLDAQRQALDDIGKKNVALLAENEELQGAIAAMRATIKGYNMVIKNMELAKKLDAERFLSLVTKANARANAKA